MLPRATDLLVPVVDSALGAWIAHWNTFKLSFTVMVNCLPVGPTMACTESIQRLSGMVTL